MEEEIKQPEIYFTPIVIRQDQDDDNHQPFFIRSDQGRKILGRKSKENKNDNNVIKIQTKTISSSNSEIFYNNNIEQFYINDSGSSVGTFIKIENFSQQVKPDMIFEIGNWEITIIEIQIRPKFLQITIKFENQMDENEDYPGNSVQKFKISPNKPIIFGSKKDQSNDVYDYKQLQGIDEHHCKISYLRIKNIQKCFIEDLNSITGLWQRLTRSKEKSLKPTILAQNSVIRLGLYTNYRVEIKNVKNVHSHREYICIMCKKNGVDAVLQPCNHQITCQECTKKLQWCPVQTCKTQITQHSKLFYQ